MCLLYLPITQPVSIERCNALKGKCTGGTGTIGYKIDDDKFYHLDPLTAPLALEAFQRYDNGDKMVEIINFLNDKGVRNMLGGKMTRSSVNTMLKNRRYIGELSFQDIVVPDAIPVIVPKDLFDRVQKRLDKNKRAPACGKADEEYLHPGRGEMLVRTVSSLQCSSMWYTERNNSEFIYKGEY